MVSIAFHSSSPSRSRILAAPRPSMAQRVLASIKVLVHEWQVRRAIKMVEAMDPHLRRDIGILPGGVEAAVRYGR